MDFAAVGILSAVMFVKRNKMAVGMFCLVVLLCTSSIKAQPVTSAKSAILMDGDTGRILWEKNADKPNLMASTTKIMTGLLIARDYPLNETVTIPVQAVGVEGSSAGLRAGECHSVEELLYGMMLHSGNDAAVALAIHHSGSLEKFVSEMNRCAAELELGEIRFANPHGLDSQQNYSTARALARLASYAMENPVFAQVVSTKTKRFEGRSYTNHNKLLWQMPEVIGVKTGYTKAAGRILVSCAQRNGRKLIAVTMEDANDWQDHRTLLEYGFSRYTRHVLYEQGEVLTSTALVGSDQTEIQAVLQESLSCYALEEENLELVFQIPQFVYAPVESGDVAGEAILYVDGKKLTSVPLVWQGTQMEGAWDGRTAAKTDLSIRSGLPKTG